MKFRNLTRQGFTFISLNQFVESIKLYEGLMKEVVHVKSAMTEEEKPVAKQAPPQFIPKLKGKKVIIRLLSGGQPVTGTLEAYNPYEILLQTTKGPMLVFKHAIAVIEIPEQMERGSWTMVE